MSGRSHTTRTPGRIGDALNRDALGFIARQTVATQDLRKVVYVSPHGKGFHKVRNPVSGEVYVVADGLGGATVVPGSVVIAASFSGQAGEVIISRPPAGFGGSASSAITVTPNRSPAAIADLGGTLTPVAFCWDASGSRAIIARRRVTDEATTVEFVKVARANIPHLSLSFGDAFLTVGNLDISAMRSGPSGSFYIYYQHAGDQVITKYSSTGAQLATVSYATDWTSTYSSEIIGGSLYSVEPRAGTRPTSGPPYDSWRRIVKRDIGTLAEQASWNLPNPSTFDGWTLRYSDIDAIVENSGTIRAYIAHVKQPPGGNDNKQVYQDYNSSLGTSGSEVQFADNPIGGVGSDPMRGGIVMEGGFSSGTILFVSNSQLHQRSLDGSGYSVVLASYDPDSGENFGIEVISSTEVLIMGYGTAFTTSILTASGQELP